MIHELLTILSGFDSELITKKTHLYHPSEQAIIAQIGELGSLHAKISRIISNINTSQTQICPAGHAISKTIEKRVVIPYRKSLVEVEKKLLRKNSGYVGGDNIMPLAQLVMLTVRNWQRVFQYSLPMLQMISREKGTTSRLIGLLIDDASVTGYEDVSRLVNHCLVAAQKAWMNQLTCWIIYGKLLNSKDFMIQLHQGSYYLAEELVPPCLTFQAAHDILVVGQSLDQSRTTALTSSIAHIMSGLEYPLQKKPMTVVVDSVKRYVLAKVISDNVDRNIGYDLLYFLRSVMLLGTDDFERAILIEREKSKDSKQVIGRALNTLVEDDFSARRLEPFFSTVHVSHSSTISVFEDITFGFPVVIVLKFDWPLRLVMSRAICHKYGKLYPFLQAMSACRYELSGDRQRTGFGKMRLKLVWDALWQNIQHVIDEQYTRLNDLFEGNYEEVRSNHEKVLDEILAQSMILDENISRTMRTLMLYCSDEELNDEKINVNIKKLVHYMTKLPVLTKEQTHLLLVLESLVKDDEK